MNQFKDVFLGRERRDYARATSSQKCMRVSGKHNDLENVGPSLHHHTFFEMLGNFSFGDYFKGEAIAFAWELLTDVWDLPPERLHATVFAGAEGIPRDGDAYDHWRRFLPAELISELGLADNFWSMGDTGPCGRCSEVHYHQGEHLPCDRPRCLGVACDCGRFVEIWNNVFMEFDRGADQVLRPLPAPSIDTGMGLERISAVLHGTLSNYETDLFSPILATITSITGVPYGPLAKVPADAASDISMRVIADHARATTFLIADGVMPSNEWRGYVLRKIMRRAMRHGKRLQMTDPFLYRLVDVVVEEMGEAYAELRANREAIVRVVQSEEERFDAVLNDGLPRLEQVLSSARSDRRAVSGDEAFRLYDTYGLPLDFIEDLAGEKGLQVDHLGFEQAMSGQRERARAGRAFEVNASDAFDYVSDERRAQLEAIGDPFDGYTTTHVSGVPVWGLFDESRRQTAELAAGRDGFLLLERTPFYIESGGQVSDVGRIVVDAGTGEADVTGLVRLAPGGPRVHRVRVTAGRLHERDSVTAEVDVTRRDATRRNHTATHLLHAALRQVLGGHVKQAGSLVAPDRLRFDFVHFAPLTREQIEDIESRVNDQIRRNTPVTTEVRTAKEAMAAGAMALFGEKYGDRVRVVSIPDFSMELCGGTHCRATGDIGAFLVLQEMGVAAGVRRVEALTGAGAIRHYQERRALLDRISETLNAPPDRAADTAGKLQAEYKRSMREVESLKLKIAMGTPGDERDDTIQVGEARLILRHVAGLDKSALRGLADTLKSRLTSGVVILGSGTDGKVAIVVSVTKDLMDRVHAGHVVKRIAPVVGGGGGGRPDFAEAGGKHAEKLDEMLDLGRQVVSEMLSGKPATAG